MDFTETNFRTPKTSARLVVKFRNGWISRHDYTADQLRWDDTGSAFDVVAYRRADGKDDAKSTWTAKSGGY